ncbi:hypothetical protein [Mycobacterium riyadhense]|uniref:hypothetical protein n=1 Tax=Mycobacterium riyadhense TaxID=486698 RepID=UPI00195EF6D0|nr:hypothetical protein [Mycobacterium riyadhense]
MHHAGRREVAGQHAKRGTAQAAAAGLTPSAISASRSTRTPLVIRNRRRAG